MNQFQSVGEIFAALRRRAWLIAAIFLIGCVLSVNYALNQQKVYEATAVVQIEDARVANTSAGALANASDTSRRLKLIEQRLMSRDNLVAVMEKHNLFNEVPDRPMSERVFMMRKAARITEIVNPGPVFNPVGNVPSGLMITVQLGDPVKAAAVANDLMASVIEQSQARSERQARETLEFYLNEEARVDGEIVALEDLIAEYKQANATQLPAGVAALRTQLTTLRDTELDLEQEIITIEGSASRKRAEDVAQQVTQLRDQRALVSARATQIEALITSAPAVERELNRLEREMDKLKDQYSVITRGKAEAEMGQALQDQQAAGRFEVLETALVPENPMSSSRKKIAAVGGFASLLLALGAGFALELLNPAIRTSQQMERMIGVMPVVAIPVVESRKDKTRGGLRFLAKGFGLFALIAGIVGWLAKTSGLGALFGAMPRRAVRG